jgi:hypothetical protein
MQGPNPHDPVNHWRPTNREQYFLIVTNGEIRRLQWNDTIFDQEVWNLGNCFRRRKDAEQALEGIKEYFVQFHNEHGPGAMSKRD